jgi:HEPN domain-containing protein
MTEALARAKPKPRIDHPDELDRMVKQIVGKVDPEAIYLFGSRARGDTDPDSDYDLLIVVSDGFPQGQANSVTAFSLVEGRRIPWTSPCRGRCGSPGVVNKSARLNTRSRARASCCMNAAIVREWLDHVEADLDAAWSCGRGPRARLDRSAYLLQQAAEKLKAVLVSADIDPPRTHDMAELVLALPEDMPFRDQLAALSALTPYATGFRYQTPQEPPPVPSRDRIDAWIAEIDALKADFERWLAQREAQP